jgi:hypothetical protein
VKFPTITSPTSHARGFSLPMHENRPLEEKDTPASGRVHHDGLAGHTASERDRVPRGRARSDPGSPSRTRSKAVADRTIATTQREVSYRRRRPIDKGLPVENPGGGASRGSDPPRGPEDKAGARQRFLANLVGSWRSPGS